MGNVTEWDGHAIDYSVVKRATLARIATGTQSPLADVPHFPLYSTKSSGNCCFKALIFGNRRPGCRDCWGYESA